MKEKEDDFYTGFDEEKSWEKKDKKSSWKEKIKEDVSRIEGFVQSEVEKGTQTERNIKAYFRERERRKQRNQDEWMEELDHVTFGFIVIEIIFISYFILALIGIVPMF